MPEMAVVVISVGAPAELSRAITSILQQDVAVELVVVNSGGGDVRMRLPQDASGIKVIALEKKVSPGVARNEGIKVSSARYVAFLAADCIAEPGWVAGRLQRHHAGAAAVANPVINSHPHHLVATAAHITLFAHRSPSIPEHLASRYGASYARQLFQWYGLFEDIRIGEDTDFYQRIGKQNQVVWAPEVRTVHWNLRSPIAAWRDQFQRGIRVGKYWPRLHQDSVWKRTKTKFRQILELRPYLATDNGWLLGHASLPLVALFIMAFEYGVKKGIASRLPWSLQDSQARAAANNARWQQALNAWTESDRLAPSRIAPALGRAKALFSLKRYGQAETAFAKVLKEWPDIGIARQEMAIAAARAGHWNRSFEAWTKLIRTSPDPLTARSGRCHALMHLGRSAEAHAELVRLKADYPGQANGYIGLARLAFRERRWEQAISAFRETWMRFADMEALRSWIGLLVNLDHDAEAEAAVGALDSKVDPISLIQLKLQILEGRHDWNEALVFLKSNEEQVLGHTELSQRYVMMFGLAGKADEALPVMAKCRCGTPSFRKQLVTTILIRSQRNEEAVGSFKEIWSSDELLGDLAPILLPSLVAAAIETGGPDFATALLTRIDAVAPRGAAGNPLRIVNLFHRIRLESLAALTRNGSDLPVPEPALENQTARILNDRSATPEVVGTLTPGKMCQWFAAWRKSLAPAFLPDPSFVLQEALAVANRILESANRGTPLSLVRLGDGEGNFLPYADDYLPFQQSDQMMTQRTYWGSAVRGNDNSAAFQRQLVAAIESADILGIPGLSRLCRVLAKDDTPFLTDKGRNARGLVAVMEYARKSFAGSPDPARILTSCHINEAFAAWGIWEWMLPKLPRLSLITCHDRLPEAMAARFGVSIDVIHLIPSESKYASMFDHRPNDAHYPAVFEKLRLKLAENQRGRTYLVAAGMLGKMYCHWIKDAGGIALDVGSAVDFWMGYQTRRMDVAASYLSPQGMSEQLRNLTERDPRFASSTGDTNRRANALTRQPQCPLP